MKYTKILIFLFLIALSLNATMQTNLIYVEDKSSSEVSLKEEFLKPKSPSYTISLATLNLYKYDPIKYFKTFNLKNAIAYKYGNQKKYARIITGVYKSEADAEEGIKKLDHRLLVNNPFPSKLSRHQDLFVEFHGIVKKAREINLPIKKKIKMKNIKKLPKKLPVYSGSSIYISDSTYAQKLKEEFLNDNSNYYSLAIGSISLKNKKSIESFFKKYNVSSGALAHVYGKNKDKARIIYGLYKSKKDAYKALESLNKSIKLNKPYPQKMTSFQSFYYKSFPRNTNNKIIELKIKDKIKEKSVKPKLSDEIKVLKRDKKIQKIKKVKPLPMPPKVIEKKVFKPKVIKEKKKIAKKTDPNAGKYLKSSKYEDIYYVESDGNFNILNEVFLNDNSSFYTIDLGEIKIQEISVEQFLIKNRMEDNALAYKYGEKKEFAKVIYGAFETQTAAQKELESLNVTDINNLKVSNVKEHQKLYKTYHKIKEKRVITPKKSNYSAAVKKDLKLVSSDPDYTVVYSKSPTSKNRLKDEFFNRDSGKFTITLMTFLKDGIAIEKAFAKFELYNDALAFPLGTINNYYRVVYGVYNSSAEANEAIENFSSALKRNDPYVSRIKTQQKKFESHNGRILENEKKLIQKVEFN